MKQEFYSNGKLLLTGEYLVLDGANALALPTRFGQSMSVKTIKEPKIIWESTNSDGTVWLHFEFLLNEITTLKKSNDKELNRLLLILKEAKKLNPNFLNNTIGYLITTKLDFPRNWGLGSSSTLINNIATWAKVDAFKLLFATFGGSGYDIAAAKKNIPILYSAVNNNPVFKEVALQWNFSDQLFFVYLNKKQNSRDAIISYQAYKKNSELPIARLNTLTLKIINSKSLQEFETLISDHEQVIAKVINEKTVKERLFKDYPRSIKSLGAWGGDFILATGNKPDWDYFKKKGFHTILSFKDMIL